MSSRRVKNHFILFMFQQDLDNMERWVLNYPNKETGGDLFGLWSDEGNAVIHVVLGPGRHCTHGNYHFYQDVSYLEKVGTLLTRDYMLGHIGEWHSHHQLRLDEPSEGDCRTVQKNFPQGACGFFLMIANIITTDEVRFTPYIFKADSRHFKDGEIQVIGKRAPFGLVSKIFEVIDDGKETAYIISRKEEDKKIESNGKSGCIGVITSLLGSKNDESLRNSKSAKSEQISSSDVPKTASKDACSSPSTASEWPIGEKPVTHEQEVSKCIYNYQWYTKDLGQAVLKDIVGELGGFVKSTINMQCEDNATQNMRIQFQYRASTVRVLFPYNFPTRGAKIKIDDNSERTIYNSSYRINSFDSKAFVAEMRKVLNRI